MRTTGQQTDWSWWGGFSVVLQEITKDLLFQLLPGQEQLAFPVEASICSPAVSRLSFPKEALLVLLEELGTSHTGLLTNNCLDCGTEREETAVPGSANIPHPSTVHTSGEMKTTFQQYGQ